MQKWTSEAAAFVWQLSEVGTTQVLTSAREDQEYLSAMYVQIYIHIVL